MPPPHPPVRDAALHLLLPIGGFLITSLALEISTRFAAGEIILNRSTSLAENMEKEDILLACGENVHAHWNSVRNQVIELGAIYRRVGLKELLIGAPVYAGATDASSGVSFTFQRWATKKSGGSTKNGKDSNPKFLGLKKFGGEKVIPGNIIVRQRGTRFHPGDCRDGQGQYFVCHALKEGKVQFERHKLSGRKYVHVDPKDGHVLYLVRADMKFDFLANKSS